MYTLLLVVLLLALLFDTAAATSPAMDPTLSASIEPLSSYPDPDNMLNIFCDICSSCGPFDLCSCFPNHAVLSQRFDAITPETLLQHPAWPQEAAYEPQAEPQPPAFLSTSPFYADAESPPLVDAIVRTLDNCTTIQPSTIQIHVEGTYNPGDRLEAASRSPTSRRPPHKRQAPKPGGFPCPVDGCGKSFDRSCDLKRHRRTHLSRSERPHKCSVCNEGFLYPKDRNRHERTHDQSQSASATLYCQVPGCANVVGFSRRDNLLRHQRNQHPTLLVTA